MRVTWVEMLHPASAYNCMIHFSGTENPGNEGFDTARLSLVIHSDGSCVYYAGGVWAPINGLTATMNKWQNHQLDVDLDSQKWTWTIDGASSGERTRGQSDKSCKPRELKDLNSYLLEIVA